MPKKKRFHLDERYITVNLTLTIVIYSVVVPFCIYLCVDNFIRKDYLVAYYALFCAVFTAIATICFAICKFGRKKRLWLMHLAINIQCFVYWITFTFFLYTGGTEGTSIFLIFVAVPVVYYFFNLFYGAYFTTVFFIIMTVYMHSPIHENGYRFPDSYYSRMPMMYLAIVIMCAIAQYEIIKARIQQDDALEEAKHASEAKTDFLANTSHEIRTPINAVLGMNEMILREDHKALDVVESDPMLVQDALENISVYSGDVKKAGHNLLAIVNDILDFSKIESGKMDIVEAPYQLSSLLNDINNMILFKAQDKGLRFTVEVDPSIPDELSGDEVRVRQILTNLLNNAVKYTDKGSVSLKLRSKMIGEGRVNLTIVIWDTGIGIRPEDKEQLFVKFERFEMERNSTVEGTGLGLAITKRLIDLMGGTVEVESEYGKGSIFTVNIPQKVENDTPIGDFQTRLKENLPGDMPYREMFRAPDARILIVDDTRINLTVAVNLLKNTKMKIDTATSGEEAVSMASKTKYDVIFMDQRMPGMDGTTAFHRIRETDGGACREVPVICLTADAVIGAKDRYLQEGFSDYLTKPIDNYALEKLLIKYLPDNKIEHVIDDPSAYEAGASSDDEEFSILRSVGIEPKAGLKYCQNDESLYKTLLGEYAYGEIEKAADIQKSYDSENWNDYSIYVHALKSSSKMIGATALSVRAAKLEAAANAGDAATIHTEHDSVMEEYEVVTAVIRSVVSKDVLNSNGDEITEFASGDEIMEFLPSDGSDE